MGSGQEEVERLRQEADEAGENLASTVGAVAYKADVKNRGKEVLEEKKEVLKDKVDELKSKVSGGEGEPGVADKVKDKLPSGEELKSKLPGGGEGSDDPASSEGGLKDKVKDAADAASGKPLAVTAGAAAAGLVAGLALPETEVEREKLAPKAKQVREDAQARAKETVQQAKAAAKETADSTVQAVRQAGEQQDGKLGEVIEKSADKAQEKVDEKGP